MESRKVYLEKLSAQVEVLDAEIQKFEAKANLAKANMKAEYVKKLNGVKQKRAEAEAKITEIRQSGDDAWEDLKTGLEESWKTLSSAVKSALSEFGDDKGTKAPD